LLDALALVVNLVFSVNLVRLRLPGRIDHGLGATASGADRQPPSLPERKAIRAHADQRGVGGEFPEFFGRADMATRGWR
jgi:hypothetical protein